MKMDGSVPSITHDRCWRRRRPRCYAAFMPIPCPRSEVLCIFLCNKSKRLVPQQAVKVCSNLIASGL